MPDEPNLRVRRIEPCRDLPVGHDENGSNPWRISCNGPKGVAQLVARLEARRGDRIEDVATVGAQVRLKRALEVSIAGVNPCVDDIDGEAGPDEAVIFGDPARHRHGGGWLVMLGDAVNVDVHFERVTLQQIGAQSDPRLCQYFADSPRHPLHQNLFPQTEWRQPSKSYWNRVNAVLPRSSK